MRKSDLAVRRLEEKLGTTFSAKPISLMQCELRQKLGEALRNTRLQEILLSDSSQATAKVSMLFGRLLSPTLWEENSAL